MKKINLISLCFILVLVLSGCGSESKTAYEQLVDDLKGTKKMQYSTVELGGAIEDFDMNFTIKLDNKNENVYISVLGFEIYSDGELVYTKLLDNWFAIEYTEDEKAEYEEAFNSPFVRFDFADGDEKIEVYTGEEFIDQYFNGKTLNELVVTTDNGYSFTDVEEYINITTANNQFKLTISYDGDEMYILLGETDEFSIPEEAFDAKVVEE